MVNYGHMGIQSGGAAYDTTLNGGDMYIVSGGVLSDTTLNSGASIYMNSGGTANSTTINYSCHMDVWYSGCFTSNTTVSSGGLLTLGRFGPAAR